ncbi:uncharacterized protein LOC106362919 [Brassica napus]|uniref:uncharacterized protein LOC106362919 n=1 Tax=Brassica napus TaxID=3708 RepID=UPI000BBE21B2|nr:uncharacterized protein LOC106362919 [Brassica napus]
MAKKKNKSISLVDLPEIDVAASGSSTLGINLSSLANLPFGSATAASGFLVPTQSSLVSGHGSPVGPVLPLVVVSPSTLHSDSPPISEFVLLSAVASPSKNYAALLKSSAQLQELGIPVEHVSGAPFVLIPDENIEAAKLKFKDFIYARFHGDYPLMGENHWCRKCGLGMNWPKDLCPQHWTMYVSSSSYNPRTREVLLSRTCWNIGGLPMFVAPWSPDYSPDEPPLTTAIVPVEMRNVPYLIFNRESLSRIATAVGKPDSLAPETERKENFEVAKLYVRVDLTAPLPNKIISGFFNGREVEIDVSYTWLPVKYDVCKKFGHSSVKCAVGVSEVGPEKTGARKSPPETSRRRSKSRPSRSIEKKLKEGIFCYVPVIQDSQVTPTNTKSKSLLRVLDTKLSQPPLDIEFVSPTAEEQKHDKNEAQSAAFEDDSKESNPAAPSESTATGVIDLAEVSTGSVEDGLVSAAADGGHSGILLNDSEKDSGNVITTLSTLTDTGSAVVSVETHGAGNSEEHNTNHPVEEHERENPFFLENISLTVTFVYGFNLVEDRRSLWNNLVDLQTSSPVSSYPWSVLGDFNQMLHTSHHSNHLTSRVDVSGMDEANICLQDAQLLEAQAKSLPYTWRNSQDDSPISTRIDHAFINQAWSTAFPDSYADFLDPSQSDHAPCLFRMPSIRRQIIKTFHVIDHPEYAWTVREAWNCSQFTGTDQFKLVRSLKSLKRPLRKLNKRHYSGVSQRVKEQREKVDTLQRSLLTTPDVSTAREEHVEREKLNVLLKAEKFYRQMSRSRVMPHEIIYIHYLKDADDRLFYSMDDIKTHAADYFKNYLKREVTAAEIKATLFAMPLNKSPGPDGYSVEFLRASWDIVREDITCAVKEFFRNGKLLKDMNITAIALIPKKAGSLLPY